MQKSYGGSSPTRRTNSPPINDTVVNGIDLSRSLRGVETVPDRTLIVQYGLPEAFRMTCVMQGPWRLLSDIKGTAKGGLELYRIDKDPMQESNVGKEVVRQDNAS